LGEPKTKGTERTRGDIMIIEQATLKDLPTLRKMAECCVGQIAREDKQGNNVDELREHLFDVQAKIEELLLEST